jgi:hypothetical protein
MIYFLSHSFVNYQTGVKHIEVLWADNQWSKGVINEGTPQTVPDDTFLSQKDIR